MTLVKASLFNSIAVAVRVASALILNKILAVYVGPAGFAVIGQFHNVFSIVVGLAGGVVATGVTKATAQHFDDEAKQHAVWQTAIRFSLVSSLIAGVSLLFVGHGLSKWLLHLADMSSVFVWLALTLPALAANNLLLAIVNGKKEVGLYVMANIMGSLLTLLVMGLLVFYFGLYGALIAFPISPAIALLSTGALVARRRWFKASFLWGTINRNALRELSGFCLMGLTSALTVPIAYMLIRDHLATAFGLTAAGYWQASWKISETYLSLITSTLSVYYLPRIAEIRTASELRAEIKNVYRFLLPLTVISAVMIFLLRDFIIHTLFTPDFSPMRELFSWQLTGDVIKMSAWMLGYVLVGRAMVRFFVVKEIGVCILFVLLTRLFVGVWGLQGVTIAYAVTSIVNWILLVYIVRYEMKQMDSNHLVIPIPVDTDTELKYG